MFDGSEMQWVPAYYAENSEGQRVPFVIALMLTGEDGRMVLPPAVEASIDRTIDITGSEGVAYADLYDHYRLEAVVPAHVDRAMRVPGAMVLLRCQSPETAEKAMTTLAAQYVISLVREPET
jgi:hypothetical protein